MNMEMNGNIELMEETIINKEAMIMKNKGDIMK